MKYAFIKKHGEVFSVDRMCRLLEVSRSAFYDWLVRPESKRSQQDKRLGSKASEIHQKSRQTYETRRIREELSEQGGNRSAALAFVA